MLDGHEAVHVARGNPPRRVSIGMTLQSRSDTSGALVERLLPLRRLL